MMAIYVRTAHKTLSRHAADRCRGRSLDRDRGGARSRGRRLPAAASQACRRARPEADRQGDRGRGSGARNRLAGRGSSRRRPCREQTACMCRGAGEALSSALESLKPERIVGSGCTRSRDEAMQAGEAGADYVMFGDAGFSGPGPDHDEIVDAVELVGRDLQRPLCRLRAPPRRGGGPCRSWRGIRRLGGRRLGRPPRRRGGRRRSFRGDPPGRGHARPGGRPVPARAGLEGGQAGVAHAEARSMFWRLLILAPWPALAEVPSRPRRHAATGNTGADPGEPDARQFPRLSALADESRCPRNCPE